jgi:release factor glutamine methyltransferase
MTKISEWLQNGTKKLHQVGIDSARLDCLILLEDTLGIDRAIILGSPEKMILPEQLNVLESYLARRERREPLAYIRGYSEFYGRTFAVNKHVLIPRPESETIIEIVRTLKLKQPAVIADVGTGSGALAVTLSLEIPSAVLYAYDIDADALRVAKQNSNKHQVDICFFQNDLLDNVTIKFDIIVANLPYVTRTQTVSEETSYEPSVALYSEDDGLRHINRLIEQVSDHAINSGGYLIIESEPRQHQSVHNHAQQYGLQLVSSHDFIQLYKSTSA